MLVVCILNFDILIATEYHVSKLGADRNSGSIRSPFLTINKAVSVAMPGDIITVHEGVYREEINPIRGGSSDAERITFRAAENEVVEIKGSEIIKGWQQIDDIVWRVSIPNSYFGEFNPYKILIQGDWFEDRGRRHHAGCVYLNNNSLTEAAKLEDLYHRNMEIDNVRYWYADVNDSLTVIYAQFPGVDPNSELVEINKRETVFYPRKPFVNYITVRGFIMRHAAPKWAPPTAEQMGLIGTHWSKGWIIENNIISHSINVGVSLGKYGDQFDNAAPTAEAYLSSIERATNNGWNKETIGGHIVRNNEISYCEQAGIAGSMGASFSQIIGNHIHHIYVQRRFGGAEMAGIKFHAPIDMLIKGNRVNNTPLGLWLDWMTQGTRVSGNLFYKNDADLFVEVNHGPAVFDNNIFASGSVDNRSQGMAFINNLFLGENSAWLDLDRATPYFKAHSTEKVADHKIDIGDAYYYNNIFIGNKSMGPSEGAKQWLDFWRNLNHIVYKGYGLWIYNDMPYAPKTANNVYLNGAEQYKKEKALQISDNTNVEIVEAGNRVYLRMLIPEVLPLYKCKKITTQILGKSLVSDCQFEDYDGNSLIIDCDFNGYKRKDNKITAGPFENLVKGEMCIKVW